MYTEEDKSNLYVQHVVKSADCKLNGLKVVMDCANGANSEIAPMILRLLGAQVIPIFNNPNGININNGCGSTHLEALQQKSWKKAPTWALPTTVTQIAAWQWTKTARYWTATRLC